MKVRLVALDMDGTVLKNDHKTISHRTLLAMQAVIDRGVWLVPATGRTYSMLPPALDQLHGIRYVLASNGAVVMDLREQRELYANRIPAETVKKLLLLLEKYKVYPQVYCFGRMLVRKDHAQALLSQPLSEGVRELISSALDLVDSFTPGVESGGVEKVTVSYVPQRQYQALWEEASALPGIVPVSSVAGNMEFNSGTANKGDGLVHLCRRLEVPLEQAMAVGDAGNDVEMLSAAGVSVAMENGFPEAKRAAKYRTAGNEEDGAALALEAWILGGVRP